MPSKKKAENAKDKKAIVETQEQGTAYVASWGTYFVPAQVNADTVSKALGNNYLREQVDRLVRRIVGDTLTVEVIDENGDANEDAATRVKAMVEQNSVNLWNAMRIAAKDIIEWGPSLFNPVWKWQDGPQGREFWLTKLRRLPPESFKSSGASGAQVFSELLPGICLGKEGSIEFYQERLGGGTDKLTDVVMLKDPASTELAGSSAVVPLIPVVTMMDFSWEAQMQQVNRIGAPSIFITVTNPLGDDIEYANIILRNWGKNNAYQLRPNMTVVPLEVKSEDVALGTIEILARRIVDCFSPSASFSKTGDTIGGNDASRKQIEDEAIKSFRFALEDGFEVAVIQPYLDANGYEGCTGVLHIGSSNLGVGDLEMKQAEVGFRTRSLQPNEIRRKLGEHDLGDDELKVLEEQYARIAPPAPQGPQLAISAEHVPTNEETELEKELKRAVEDLAGKTIKALEG